MANKERQRLKLKYVDMGSGDGTTVLSAASHGFRATGLELNPSLWFISSLRRLSSTNEVRSNSQFIFLDMFKNRLTRQLLQEANCVMIFGVKPLMPQISQLVLNECQHGCYIMSYWFHLPQPKNLTKEIEAE